MSLTKPSLQLLDHDKYHVDVIKLRERKVVWFFRRQERRRERVGVSTIL
jgi:hypothetical protein